jgi:cephalosporin hydroxylase
LNVTGKIVSLRRMRKAVIKEFNRLYYNSTVWGNGGTRWLGTTVLKCPTDLWIYQEILYELKPDVIVETGTFNGGSAYYFACLFDLIGKGEIITIDVEDNKERPKHDRVTYLKGFSTSKEIFEKVEDLIKNKQTVMVVLDSDHIKENVLNELKLYSALVTENSYLVVEDTNINGHPALPDFGPGPMEALEEFLLENKDFVVDESKEKFFLTFNPKGYLRKKTLTP